MTLTGALVIATAPVHATEKNEHRTPHQPHAPGTLFVNALSTGTNVSSGGFYCMPFRAQYAAIEAATDEVSKYHARSPITYVAGGSPAAAAPSLTYVVSGAPPHYCFRPLA